jgi:hypothetical protein
VLSQKPFVSVCTLPDKTYQRKSNPIASGELSACWEEVSKNKLVLPLPSGSKSILLQVWDENRTGGTLAGSTTIPIADISEATPQRQWYTLDTGGKVECAIKKNGVQQGSASDVTGEKQSSGDKSKVLKSNQTHLASPNIAKKAAVAKRSGHMLVESLSSINGRLGGGLGKPVRSTGH